VEVSERVFKNKGMSSVLLAQEMDVYDGVAKRQAVDGQGGR
jgi:hypothetical protein